MTFKQLSLVNEGLSALPIHGKEYVMVNERIKAFRALCPDGSISTEIIAFDPDKGSILIKATVRDEFDHVIGTGHAFEKEGSSKINETSFIENCETSAVGRALGMVGIGIDTSIASAEEMENAIKKQEETNPISKEQKAKIEACIPKHNQTVSKVCEAYGIKDLSKLTVKQYLHLMHRMDESPEIQETH